MAGVRPTLVILASLLVVVLTIGMIRRSIDEPPGGEPCPSRPRHARPAAFHFTPGLQEHRSWIQFSVPEADATDFVLCLDGRLWSKGGGHTPDHGVVRVSVNTTWVNLKWVSGLLNDYTSVDRWELGYSLHSLPPLSR